MRTTSGLSGIPGTLGLLQDRADVDLLLLEALPAAVIIVDQTQHVIWANRRAGTLLRQPSNQLWGTSVSHLLVPLGERSPAGGPTANDGAFTESVKLVTNEWLACESTCASLTDDFGSVLGQIVMLRPLPLSKRIQGLEADQAPSCGNSDEDPRDALTVRKVIQERDLYLTLLKNVRQMESLGLMTAGVTHDLNNVLTAITGYAELCEADSGLSERTQKCISRIREAARRGTEMVAQVLHFARTEHTVVSRLSLAIAVEEALDLLAATKPANVTIRKEFDEEDCEVYCSRTQVHQIVLNICRNAVQAIGAAGGTVAVRIRLVDQDPAENPELCLPRGQYPCLEIEDTGPGIAPEDLPHLFTPLFRRAKGSGSGIGLALVNAIVTALGGVITVQSTLGAGTRFRVYFMSKDRQHAEPSAPEVTPRHILLVDDEPNIVQVLKLMLVRSGFVVTVASSGATALEIFQAAPSKIDLLITDLHMPGLRGDHLARAVARQRPDLPILFITGHVEELQLCMTGGQDEQHVLMKPFNISELLRGIQHAAATHCTAEVTDLFGENKDG